MSEANSAYNKAVEEGKTIKKPTMELAWSAAGFDDLIKKFQGLQHDLNRLVDGAHDVDLTGVKLELLSYHKGLFSKKRVVQLNHMRFLYASCHISH